MTPRRRIPPALAEQALPLLLLAGALALAALLGIVSSVFGALEAETIDQRSLTATATVVTAPSGMPDDGRHVPVRYEVGGEARTGLAPVLDAGAYRPGREVEVRYDTTNPSRVRLAAEPYDLATPLAFSIGIGLVAAAIALGAVWWPWRVTRLARSAGPAFAFAGRIGEQRRRIGRPRPWVVLDALDARPGSPPVAAVPLVRHQALPGDQPFDARVKGVIRDGAAAVVEAGGRVLWPSGRVRVGEVPGLAGDRH